MSSAALSPWSKTGGGLPGEVGQVKVRSGRLAHTPVLYTSKPRRALPSGYQRHASHG